MFCFPQDLDKFAREIVAFPLRILMKIVDARSSSSAPWPRSQVLIGRFRRMRQSSVYLLPINILLFSIKRYLFIGSQIRVGVFETRTKWIEIE